MIWAAPQVIAPGSVQPGNGIGRSIAPVARIIRSAATARARPPSVKCAVRSGVTSQTVAPGR
jgi:hypothetical protein